MKRPPSRSAEQEAFQLGVTAERGQYYLSPRYPLSNRLMRLAWAIVYWTLFRFSPRTFHPWRALLLRLFGAKLGPRCHIYASARVWAPWNLRCGPEVSVGDHAFVYNTSPVSLGRRVVVSREAFLCGASHDYNDPAFTLISAEISIGDFAWICARATVMPGVDVGEGAVLGLGSVATHDLPRWSVWAGIPAKQVKERHADAYGK